jgi:hypothetical protein
MGIPIVGSPFDFVSDSSIAPVVGFDFRLCAQPNSETTQGLV